MGFHIQSVCRTDAVAKRVSFEFISNRSTLRESIHTTKFLGLVTLTNFIHILYCSVVANVVIDQKVPRHVHQVLVSLS